MSAARNVMEIVDRKLELLEIEKRVIGIEGKTKRMPEGQTTADFFSVLDRRELLKQGVQLEQILRDLGDVRITAKEQVKEHSNALEAHEKRLRALEDDRLELRTQIKTSWRWIVLLSAISSAVMNFGLKLLLK